MSAADPLARVLPTDRLYRKLRPDQWDPESLEVYPAAFIDRHPHISVYVARVIDPKGGPRAILESFCRFPFARQLAPGRAPLPEDLHAAGHGVAVLPARLLSELGLEIDPEPDGSEIRPDGHVNVRKAERDFSIDLAESARALSGDEIFGAGDSTAPQGHA